MEQGTDGKELHANDNPIEIEIEHKGKLWKFKVVEPDFDTMVNIIQKMKSSSTNTRAGITVKETKLNEGMNKIYLACVKGAPEGFEFRKSSFEFGIKLMNSIPGLDGVFNIASNEEKEKN